MSFILDSHNKHNRLNRLKMKRQPSFDILNWYTDAKQINKSLDIHSN